jgi:hypothetical protein
VALYLLLALIALAGELHWSLTVCLYLVVNLLNFLGSQQSYQLGLAEGYLQCWQQYKNDIAKSRGIQNVEEM